MAQREKVPHKIYAGKLSPSTLQGDLRPWKIISFTECRFYLIYMMSITVMHNLAKDYNLWPILCRHLTGDEITRLYCLANLLSYDRLSVNPTYNKKAISWQEMEKGIPLIFHLFSSTSRSSRWYKSPWWLVCWPNFFEASLMAYLLSH